MAIAEYRLALGSLTYSALEADTTSIIENWPVQSDMDTGRIWYRPDDEAERVLENAVLVQSIDHRTHGYGTAEATFRFQGLSPKMVAYIISTFFSAGVYNADVTFSTFNRASGEWEVYQAVANRDNNAEAQLEAGGYHEYTIKFVNLSQQAAPPPHPTAFSSGFTAGFE